ncbi:MAG TPA: hypothetical protein VGI66_05500 [Streptosporangiaceae bacterium]
MAALAVVGGVLAVGATMLSAQAATTGWRRSAAVAAGRGVSTTVNSITAVSAKDAWAIGAEGLKPGTGLVDHWAGTSWRRVRLPAKVQRGWNAFASESVLGAASSTDVWAISSGPTGPTRSRMQIHYLRLDGRRWSVGTIPGTAVGSGKATHFVLVQTVKVISPTDVWAFGGVIRSGSVPIEPLAEHFDGRRWARRPVPGNGLVVSVAVFSARKILALVGSNDNLGLGTPTPSLEQWNGTSWTPSAVQPPHLPPSPLAGLTAMYAGPDGHIWLAGDRPRYSPASGYTHVDFIAERSRSGWKVTDLKTPVPSSDFPIAGIVPDGSGGLWALGITETQSSSQLLWHFAHGAWTAALRPAFGGDLGALVQLAAVPGTRSVWGVGSYLQKTPSSETGLIAIDGPTPR